MSKQDYIDDLTLMLMYLTSWEEGSGSGSYRRTWKGYDFDSLDRLADAEMIGGSHRTKSDYITEAGAKRARELCKRYGMDASDIDGIPCFRVVLTFNFRLLKCRRELLVPKDLTFDDFHTVIQACIGWLNYHLYDFRATVDGQQVKISIPDDDWLSHGDTSGLDSRATKLSDVFPATRTALYSYDYGDGWEIKLRVCKGADHVSYTGVPQCISFEGEAPPDDVGGEGGFERFLAAINDPSNPEHDHMVEWGEDQGFERADIDSINDRLAHWKDYRAIPCEL